MIAARLDRHPSSIYRELKRNHFHDEDPIFRSYFPTVAHDKARGRRVRGGKLARDPDLVAQVVDRLHQAWSPEQIAGYLRRHRPRGFYAFGRALDALNIEIICANSPQAKGRVKRANGSLQDRLVKAMRLAGIATIESGERVPARLCRAA